MDNKEIKKIVDDAIDDKFGHLVIDPAIHHRDHLIMSDIDSKDVVFLKSLKAWLCDIKTTAWRCLIRIVIPGIFVLIVAGIVSYIKLHKGH